MENFQHEDKMCLNASDVFPYCDECWENRNNEIELCDDCKKIAERYCDCCMTLYDTNEEANLIEGVCKKCREEQ
jgi:hypothetical protein